MTVNPLTKEQLIAYIRQLDDEYRRNRDAAMTLLRSIQAQDAAQGIVAAAAPPRDDTTIGLVEKIMSSQPEEHWTVGKLRSKLREVKPDHKAPDKTLGNCMAKLVGRGKAELLKKGIGSIPSIYRWKGGSVVGFPAANTLWGKS